jgi:hypothetical protein
MVGPAECRSLIQHIALNLCPLTCEPFALQVEVVGHLNTRITDVTGLQSKVNLEFHLDF